MKPSTLSDGKRFMKGIIRFRPYAQGSKSESVRPFLEVEGEEPLRLHLEGDNPFSNDGLRSFEDKECEVTGQMDKQNGFFRVNQAEVITKAPTDQED